MSKEKKRPRLSFKEKHEVAGQVKAGVSKQEILQKYGISDKTYRRVIARESELNNKVKRYQFLNKKSAKTSDNMVLEDALMEWFKIARDKGDPMSGPIMQEKARIFNEKLNGSQTFKIMAQNPTNALLCVGNSKGVVSMWSPNSKQPLAKMLCHHTAINALAIHPYGTYMATSGPDYKVKIWDLRQLAGPLQTVGIRSPANYLSYSQKGLLAIGMGNVVEVFKDTSTDLKPYMRHRENWAVTSMQFCPFEDILGVATTKGFTSILVPGSGEANFDALELNPFQTKSQRREAEVKALLDKIQPELITLDPYSIHEVDVPSLKEKVEAKKKLLYLKPKDIDFTPRKTKAKGKGGTAKVVKSKKILKQLAKNEAIQAMREANVLKDIKKTEVRKKSFGVLDRFLPKS
ncbi:WD repeat-containing protein 46 isoform X3 [Belonocnema kinseyi]|uniref:WD repeat-containing protein 46 isoform X3 n=1 Tax=Belonocnema kinseyi TaxID=2817044 RepID=UPI00143E04A0|nr:WD repeat-containing protein 46 isoform X3 [Belonocnema kinseyi]